MEPTLPTSRRRRPCDHKWRNSKYRFKENDGELKETHRCRNDCGDGDFGRTDAGSEFVGAKSIAECAFLCGRTEQSARAEVWPGWEFVCGGGRSGRDVVNHRTMSPGSRRWTVHRRLHWTDFEDR